MTTCEKWLEHAKKDEKGIPTPYTTMEQTQRVQHTATKDPEAIALATFLRNHSLLKVRSGQSNNSNLDFFRYKRCVRALVSDEYNKAQAKSGIMPQIDSDPLKAQQAFILLIKNQFVLPVTKLSTSEARAKGFKPTKTSPCLEVTQKAVLQPDVYFAWSFNPPNKYLVLYSILGLMGVFTVILFPLWPMFMRKGVWYLSTGLLFVIGLFFLMAIVRLVIYAITVIVLPKGFWLYPNLFADCGFLESFKPVYAWDEPKKSKKSKGAKSGGEKQGKGKPSKGESTQAEVSSSEARHTKKVVLEDVD